jgi:hypothetical protein
MRLTDLAPEWCGGYDAVRHSFCHPATFAEAQGIWFLCPVCFKKNGGGRGTHMVLVWFKDRNVPPEAEPEPRWGASGTGFNDLTLTPSIDTTKNKAGIVIRPDEWHGFISVGEITGA